MKVKSLVIMLGVLCLVQAQLFPLIAGRIQGVVKDAETGAAISNVKVSLFIYRVRTKRDYHREDYKWTMTGQNGRFVFDDLKNDCYFVMCRHEDYLISVSFR